MTGKVIVLLTLLVAATDALECDPEKVLLSGECERSSYPDDDSCWMEVLVCDEDNSEGESYFNECSCPGDLELLDNDKYQNGTNLELLDSDAVDGKTYNQSLPGDLELLDNDKHQNGTNLALLDSDAVDAGLLETGIDICISDCSSDFDFLSTCTTGSRVRDSQMCDNEITRAVTSRGGPGCRADTWYIVEQCNEACYEFGWRASYPSLCDVEDRWLWCCSAKVEVTDTFVCGEDSRADLVCVVQDHHVHIDEDVIYWVDAFGESVADFPGFEVSRTYKIDDDKISSVLSIDSSVLQHSVDNQYTCVVHRPDVSGQDGLTWEAVGTVTKFEVLVSDVFQPRGYDAELDCAALGIRPDDPNFEAARYYFDSEGNRVNILDTPEKFSLSAGDSSFDPPVIHLLLTYFGGFQETGVKRHQCAWTYYHEDKCGHASDETCVGEGTVHFWDITKDYYCAQPSETVVLSATIEGYPFLKIETVTVTSDLGFDITSEEAPEGYTLTGVYNEDDDLVIILTVSGDVTLVPGTEEFSTFVNGESPFGSNPNLIMHIMDLIPGTTNPDGTEGKPELTVTEETVVATVSVDGGTLSAVVWMDDQGNTFTEGEDPVSGTIVEVDPEDKTSTITLTKDFVEEYDIKSLTVSSRLITETGDYCRRDSVVIRIPGITECVVVWDEPICDDTVSCYDHEQFRTYHCVCNDNPAPLDSCPVPAYIPTFFCPHKGEWELTPWTPETCDNESCYGYQQIKSRSCLCEDLDGEYENDEQCNEPEMQQFYYCPASKPWGPGDWLEGSCPQDACHPSTTTDIRDCVCDQYTDRSKCSEELERDSVCEPTGEFNWSEWGDEVCPGYDRCYPATNAGARKRSCTCVEHGEYYRDNAQCDGSSFERMDCPANMPWVPVEDGDPCSSEPAVVSANTSPLPNVCHPSTGSQLYTCSCEANNEEYFDNAKCDLPDPTPVLCQGTGNYEWNEWSSVSECSICYPELEQQFVRTCGCGEDIDNSNSRCEGPSVKAEECPLPKIRFWIPTEWSDIPCGDLSCDEMTYSTKTRSCECDGDRDNSRCEEPMIEQFECGIKEYEISEWSNGLCDEHVCYEYAKTKTRSCVCEDNEGSHVDLDQCNPGPVGYEVEFTCDGDSYEWGEWQSRGCPESCRTSRTKRYRVCDCHGHILFSECTNGTAIEFYDCEPTFQC